MAKLQEIVNSYHWVFPGLFLGILLSVLNSFELMQVVSGTDTELYTGHWAQYGALQFFVLSLS